MSHSFAAKGEAESFPLQGGGDGAVTVTEVRGGDGATPSRALGDEDFARGFVLTCVGTGEAYGFAAPSNATVCADWEATGAATDWTYLAPTGWSMRIGDATAYRLRVHSDGWVEALPDGGSPRPAVFAPLRTALGLVPEAKWPLLPASARPSLLWHLVTPSNTLLVTWRNALLGRSPSAPVSLQLELGQGGSADFRYCLSSVPDGAALPAASACGATAPMDRQVTSLGFASDLDALAALSPSFGLPVHVCTNAEDAAALTLATDVLLGGMNIHVGFEGADAPFALWVRRRGGWRRIASRGGPSASGSTGTAGRATSRRTPPT